MNNLNNDLIIQVAVRVSEIARDMWDIYIVARTNIEQNLVAGNIEDLEVEETETLIQSLLKKPLKV